MEWLEYMREIFNTDSVNMQFNGVFVVKPDNFKMIFETNDISCSSPSFV
jgi:hypothetical protein